MKALVNVEAERTVLGCVLLDQDVLYRVLPVLEAEDFSADAHRRIYQAVRDLADEGKPVDDMTVTDRLITKGLLEDVGGVAYITNLSDNLTGELARVTNVEYYAATVLDKSRRRDLHSIGACLVHATEDPGVTTGDCLDQVEDALLRIQAASASSTGAKSTKDLMPEVIRDLEVQASNKGLIGMTTGLASVDMATGGIRPGELWTVGALPGKGKSSLAIQMLLANAAAATPVCAFSLEMQDTEIGKRFLAARSAIPANQIRNPQYIKRERWLELGEAAAALRELPIYVDSRPSLTIQQLVASARLYIRRFGVRLVVVDYLRLVEAPGRDLRERLGNVANALRQLAKAEHVGVVQLSQLRRPDGGTNTRPTMLDLKESGDIEAHSHVVLLPYLPVTENGQLIPEEQLLIIGKNRNGSVGALPVYFDEMRLQFYERSDRDHRTTVPEQPHTWPSMAKKQVHNEDRGDRTNA